MYPAVDWREWGAKCKQRAVHEAHYPWNAMQHHSVPAERRRQYTAFVREEIFKGTPMMTGQEAYFGKLCKRFAAVAVPAATTHTRGTEGTTQVPHHALTRTLCVLLVFVLGGAESTAVASPAAYQPRAFGTTSLTPQPLLRSPCRDRRPTH